MTRESALQRTRARIKLLLLALACALPLIAASLAYRFDWMTGGSANYGELLPPRALAAPPFDSLRGKWVLVSFDVGACDSYCERKLYLMRQIRRAQNREQTRLERLWLVTDRGAPRPGLQPMIEGTRIVALDTAISAYFPAAADRRDHIYLVDPLGNLILRYARDPDPSRMIKDLQRLLKYSGFG